MYRVSSFVPRFAQALLGGAALATIWVNLAPARVGHGPVFRGRAGDFRRGHPALHLLLLVAIATDILALLIAGLTHPAVSLRLAWLLLPLVAGLAVWLRFGRPPPPDAPERERRARDRLLPYILAGILSWVGVAASGLPAALGLLPVIPAIAHADRSFGLFAEAEEALQDPLNRLAHALIRPVMAILFLFGLTRGGVELSAFAPTTVTTLASLWVGRPLGMLIGGIGLIALLALKLPSGVRLRDILRMVPILAMGFSVPVLAWIPRCRVARCRKPRGWGWR